MSERLGAGTFAIIYALQPRNDVAIKSPRMRVRYPELEQEFESHGKIHAAAAAAEGTLFKVPKPLTYYTDFDKQVELDGPCVYTMQRVWPIPRALAASIRKKFFPPSEAGCVRPFIARIYLGRNPEPRTRQSRFFDSNNFPLYVGRCEELELPVKLLAAEMGKLLARIHYDTGLDGRDIEFVLGGGELLSDHGHGFYCFDFNQCQPHENKVENLVTSFMVNDPYYPRPGMRYWEEFKQGYTAEASLKESKEAVELAESFLRKIEEAVAMKIAEQPPEGRGNEMAFLERAS